MHPDATMDSEEKAEIRKLTDALKGQVKGKKCSSPRFPTPLLQVETDEFSCNTRNRLVLFRCTLKESGPSFLLAVALKGRVKRNVWLAQYGKVDLILFFRAVRGACRLAFFFCTP